MTTEATISSDAATYKHLVDHEGHAHIFGVYQGKPFTATEGWPNYRQLVAALEKGLDPTPFLTPAGVTDIGGRFAVVDDKIFFDAKLDVSFLATTIRRYVAEGRDTANLVKFAERLDLNPSHRSREQLYGWTMAKDLTINEDGLIVAYKGVSEDHYSIHSGAAYVNGVLIEGKIPNEVGSVITMDRRDVSDDFNDGCSTGLHVGNWGYASTFGPVTLQVLVDPADVVSVPRDSYYQKLRCCRYEVVAVHTIPEDDLEEYEPPATSTVDEDIDIIADLVPPSFFEKLVDRLTRSTRTRR